MLNNMFSAGVASSHNILSSKCISRMPYMYTSDMLFQMCLERKSFTICMCMCLYQACINKCNIFMNKRTSFACGIARGVVLYRPGRARALPMFVWALLMFREPYQSFVWYHLMKRAIMNRLVPDRARASRIKTSVSSDTKASINTRFVHRA